MHQPSPNKKYLKVAGQLSAAGLNHQTSNLQALLAYAYDRQLVPVMPEFPLTGMHNQGRALRSNLARYYDYDKLHIKGKPFPVLLDDRQLAAADIEVIQIPDGWGLLRLLLPPTEVKSAIDLPYSPEVAGHHKEFARAAAWPDYACVHIRRTDYLHKVAELDQLTRGEHLYEVLARTANCPELVYIMTDELDREVFTYQPPPRGRQFQFRFYDDYELLRQLKAEDNYLLFCVENMLMRAARHRVSTFKTPLPLYHDYLCERAGWC